jgi:negative regulator of sigma E activity
MTKTTTGKDRNPFTNTVGFPDVADEPGIPSRRDQRLQMLFDEELDDGDAAEVAREVDRDPELRRHLEQMGTMRDLVSRSLELRASEVPRARFEQIWDEIDRSIDAEQKAARAAVPESTWSRVWAAFRPYRTPVLAAAGAAALALVVVQFTGDDGMNRDSPIASVPETPPAQGLPETGPTPAPSVEIAQRMPEAPTPPEVFPTPKAASAEIHSIEFGGKAGRISHNGTVTVLYVEEGDSPQKSERSL